MNTETILGIDLSGYQTKRTAAVLLKISDGEATFEIIEDHPFNDFEPSRELISSQIEREIFFLNNMNQKQLHHIVIDAPIDLSQLPLGILVDDYSLVSGYGLIKEIDDVWRLRMRPIDKVFNGLPPLFSPLGVVTQRARLALSKSYASETYPKISRRLVGYDNTDSSSHLESFKAFLAAHGVSLVTHAGKINDDEFDAIWCALAGISTSEVVTDHQQALENGTYATIVEEYSDVPWPKDYRLLASWPKSIHTVTIARQ